ncbi:hypothetical protein LGK95_21265 [Clostridium algoriphilum]|uniref:hypothetical protein n=1 Tax=Clostridium algoriphilum TaxID=198347 RepID=UPI001CF5C793|nr:hypothetical protein [Clostridium algoriphilum]MCB2295986.1 hypothetical protein [Clostridium algoriphilum]
MKNRDCDNSITNVIAAIIPILYSFFLFMDFYNVKAIIRTEHIKYLCILLCFLLAILNSENLFVGTNTSIVKYRDI